MFIGHFGVGFGLKRNAPTVSLGTLFLGAQFVDLLWPTLLLTGTEHVEILSAEAQHADQNKSGTCASASRTPHKRFPSFPIRRLPEVRQSGHDRRSHFDARAALRFSLSARQSNARQYLGYARRNTDAMRSVCGVFRVVPAMSGGLADRSVGRSRSESPNP